MYKFRGAGGERHGSYLPPDTSTGLPWSQRPPDLPRFTCGIAPRSLVRFFTGLDFVKNILGVVVVIYLYVLLRLSDKDELLKFYSTNEDMILFLNFPHWQQRGLLFLILFLFLLSLGFSIVVWLGAKQHHYRKLRYWFIYQLTLLLLYTALHVWMFFYGWFLPDRPRKIVGSLFFIFFLNYLWQGYHLYVTALLMTDITFQAGVLARNRFNFTNVQTDAFNRSATYRR